MNRTYAPRDRSYTSYGRPRYRSSQAQRPAAGGAWRSDPATEAQLGRLERTLSDNDLHASTAAGDWDRLWNELEAARIDQRNPGDGTPMSKGSASRWIDALETAGFRPGAPQRPASASQPQERRSQPAELGLYRRDGRLFVVREFTPQGEDRKVRFARELVETTGGQADRAGLDGEARKLRGVKAPGMQWQLRQDEAVSLEEVAALGIKFGECLICGTPIETKESVEDRGGIGPVCYGRQAALLERGA